MVVARGHTTGAGWSRVGLDVGQRAGCGGSCRRVGGSTAQLADSVEVNSKRRPPTSIGWQRSDSL
jgi:hypothetical protein